MRGLVSVVDCFLGSCGFFSGNNGLLAVRLSAGFLV